MSNWSSNWILEDGSKLQGIVIKENFAKGEYIVVEGKKVLVVGNVEVILGEQHKVNFDVFGLYSPHLRRERFLVLLSHGDTQFMRQRKKPTTRNLTTQTLTPTIFPKNLRRKKKPKHIRLQLTRATPPKKQNLKTLMLYPQTSSDSSRTLKKLRSHITPMIFWRTTKTASLKTKKPSSAGTL